MNIVEIKKNIEKEVNKYMKENNLGVDPAEKFQTVSAILSDQLSRFSDIASFGMDAFEKFRVAETPALGNIRMLIIVSLKNTYYSMSILVSEKR